MTQPAAKTSRLPITPIAFWKWGFVVVVCVSCASQPRRAAEQSNYILDPKVGRFLRASADTYVWVTQTKDQEDRYVLAYSQDRKTGVVLDVERNFPSNPAEACDEGFGPGVRNIGFGTAARNGEWALYHDPDPETGEIYESQAGLWTVHNLSNQLAKGLKQQQKRVPFKEVNRFVTGVAK